jgi:hypothetical protein
MKKWFLRIGLILAVLLIVAFAAAAVFLNDIVKKGVETAGPMITKVDVKLDSAAISIFSGSANLKGLFVGNPPGYATDSAIKVGDMSVRLKLMSVLSGKIIVESINVKAPEITLEGGLKDNNLARIQNNVNAFSGGSPGGGSAANGAAKKKFQVNSLLVSGAILRVKSPLLAGKMTSVPLPDIHLENMGTGPDGVTPAELTGKVMNSLMKQVIPAVAKLAGNVGAEAAGLGKGVEKQGENTLNKASKGLKSLFGN